MLGVIEHEDGCLDRDGIANCRNRWEIISTEAYRIYQFYVGLPVSPRTWKIEVPHLDEL
jgi:hypothetical protein